MILSLNCPNLSDPKWYGVHLGRASQGVQKNNVIKKCFNMKIYISSLSQQIMKYKTLQLFEGGVEQIITYILSFLFPAKNLFEQAKLLLESGTKKGIKK